MPTTASSSVSPAGEPLDASALREAVAALEAAIAARRLPGAVLWIEKLGAPPFVQHVGERAWEPSPEPLAVDAVYDCASLTKPVVTGLLCAQLFEQGRAALDEPVRRHWTAFEAGATLTWRHLLTHGSGLAPVLSYVPDWHGREPALAKAAAARPTSSPGREFRYSDINYIVLGTLIERIHGAPLEEVAQREIFAPLAMHDSGYLPLRRHPLARLVPTAVEDGELLRGRVHDPSARRMGGVAGHAGLFSTVADLARFARMVLQGGALEGTRLLRRETVAQMTRNSALPGLAARGWGWDIDSSFSRPRGRFYPVLSSFGHTGFTGCAMWLDPGSQSFYVLLSNRVHPSVREPIVDVYEAVGSAAARAAGVPAR